MNSAKSHHVPFNFLNFGYVQSAQNRQKEREGNNNLKGTSSHHSYLKILCCRVSMRGSWEFAGPSLTFLSLLPLTLEAFQALMMNAVFEAMYFFKSKCL